MKLTTVCEKLYKRGTKRFPHMEHYKYDYYREPVLKDKVSGQGEREPRAVCIEEMMLMLSCLKNNEYNETSCTRLIDNFKNCVEVAESNRAKSKLLRNSGTLGLLDDSVIAKRRLPASQVNLLLQRYPEPR